jgi:hypothetical protein
VHIVVVLPAVRRPPGTPKRVHDAGLVPGIVSRLRARTRIKEAHDGGQANRDAIATGLQHTGRVVTAGAIMVAVALGAFGTSHVVFLKELGLGTAAAVLIDAFIIRALLVPALMALGGRELVVTAGPAPVARPPAHQRGRPVTPDTGFGLCKFRRRNPAGRPGRIGLETTFS